MFNLLRTGFLVIALAFTASAASEENISQQVDAAPGGKLIVDVDFGAINVTAATDGKVTVEAHRKVDFGDEAKEKEYLAAGPVTISKDGNTITVRAHSPKHDTFWSFRHSRTDGQYTVSVPRNFNTDLHTAGGSITASELTGSVEAQTSGGKLKFTHLEGAIEGKTSGGSIQLDGCNGPVEIETSGGDITTVDGRGSLHARTSGGGIHVRNFSGDTDVKTSGGKLTLNQIDGKLTGKTSGGSISASVPGPAVNEVNLESSAGSIDLRLPASAAIDINAQTSAGRITTTLPVVLVSADHEHLRGRLNGGGKSVLLRTSAGSITIGSSSSETAAR
ncbi:MAG: hypothetical protein QOH24_923 [Verrucomicrobiota bacterium]|jgi:hypothetical protein